MPDQADGRDRGIMSELSSVVAEFGRSLWGKVIGALTIIMMLIGIYVELVGAWRATYDAKKAAADSGISEAQNAFMHSNIYKEMEARMTPRQKAERAYAKCLHEESANLIDEMGVKYTEEMTVEKCKPQHRKVLTRALGVLMKWLGWIGAVIGVVIIGLFVSHFFREQSPDYQNALVKNCVNSVNPIIFDLKQVETCSLILTGDNQSPQNRSFAYAKRADAYKNKREWDSAIADYSQAINLAPSSSSLYRDRGEAYNSKGENDQALADFNMAIRLDSNEGFNFISRGDAWFEEGDFTKAIEDYNSSVRDYELWWSLEYWIDRFSGNPELFWKNFQSMSYSRRGRAYLARGDFEHAAQDLEDLEKIFRPRNPLRSSECLGGGAMKALATSSLESAVSGLNAEIERNQSPSIWYRARGYAWCMQGDSKKAFADWEKTDQLDKK